jgi:hypothetical protein
MLIHWQNLYAPRGKQRTGHREAQSHEPVNEVKNSLYMCRRLLCLHFIHEGWSHNCIIRNFSDPICHDKDEIDYLLNCVKR